MKVEKPNVVQLAEVLSTLLSTLANVGGRLQPDSTDAGLSVAHVPSPNSTGGDVGEWLDGG